MTKQRKNKRSKNVQSNYHRPNLWGMIQNILIAAMNKGQLLPATIALFLIIWALKSDAEAIGETFNNAITSSCYLGWILLIVCIMYWAYTTKQLRRTHYNEVHRIAEEKKKLQEKLLHKK